MAKKSKATSVKKFKPTVVTDPAEPTLQFTAGNFKKYVDDVAHGMSGFLHLAEVLATAQEGADRQSAERVPFYILKSTEGQLYDLLQSFEDRFKDEHGGRAWSLDNDKAIAITSQEGEAYQEAVGPMCAFVDLLARKDRGESFAMQVAVNIANAGVTLRDRAVEGVCYFLELERKGGAQ